MLTCRLRNLITFSGVLVLLFAAAVQVSAADDASKQPSGAASKQAVDKGAGSGAADKSGDDFFASLNSDEKKAEEEESQPVYITALGFIFRLAIVLVLAYGTIYALKRFGGMKGTMGVSNRKHIRVLENSALGTNKSLHVVEVGSRKFLVASTPSSVNLISELQDADLPQVEAPEPPAAPAFKDQLQSFLSNKQDSTNAAKSVAQMLRESSAFFSEKVIDMGRQRKKFRNDP